MSSAYVPDGLPTSLPPSTNGGELRPEEAIALHAYQQQNNHQQLLLKHEFDIYNCNTREPSDDTVQHVSGDGNNNAPLALDKTSSTMDAGSDEASTSSSAVQSNGNVQPHLMSALLNVYRRVQVGLESFTIFRTGYGFLRQFYRGKINTHSSLNLRSVSDLRIELESLEVCNLLRLFSEHYVYRFLEPRPALHQKTITKHSF